MITDHNEARRWIAERIGAGLKDFALHHELIELPPVDGWAQYAMGARRIILSDGTVVAEWQ